MNDASIDFLYSVLEQFAPIPAEEMKKVAGRINTCRLEKDEYFVRQGSRPARLALISSGVFRVYCLTESGEEKTLAFRRSGQFIAAFSPYLMGTECWYSIQALTRGDVVSVPIEAYTDLSDGHHCWNRIINNLIISLYIEKEERERSFLTEDAATRYLKFKETYPEIEKTIPQFYIASYLGISPVSLSRIRKNLKKELKLT